ncbi:VOC family protein [Bradyrhizobium sp.]|uniref:VOC family protein n=1 Tax=Bradyrhizobium sp. TaxID=376 RepID=UPI00351E4E7E
MTCSAATAHARAPRRHLHVAVTDPDALHARVKASGARIEMELHNTDYGSRDFACRDPEGNLWSFGTYWPKVTEKPEAG